jgi:hypothetical protein
LAEGLVISEVAVNSKTQKSTYCGSRSDDDEAWEFSTTREHGRGTRRDHEDTQPEADRLLR